MQFPHVSDQLNWYKLVKSEPSRIHRELYNIITTKQTTGFSKQLFADYASELVNAGFIINYDDEFIYIQV